MARTVTPKKLEPVINMQIQHTWKRVSGKLYFKEGGVKKVIVPGDVIIAPDDFYIGNAKWIDLGPVVVEKHVVQSTPTFHKEQTKEGWYLYKDQDKKPFNDVPLTEQEVDEIINATLENS